MYQIKMASENNLSDMLQLVRELADYEKAPDSVIVSLQDMKQYFKEHRFESYVAIDDNNQLLGMALFYWSYSTWKGKIVYLDDLVVTHSQRRKGIGEALFNKLIDYCKTHKANQLRWHVLDWNKPAIEFYKKHNADLDDEWITCKFEKEYLR